MSPCSAGFYSPSRHAVQSSKSFDFCYKPMRERRGGSREQGRTGRGPHSAVFLVPTAAALSPSYPKEPLPLSEPPGLGQLQGKTWTCIFLVPYCISRLHTACARLMYTNMGDFCQEQILQEQAYEGQSCLCAREGGMNCREVWKPGLYQGLFLCEPKEPQPK